jgi:DNA polymerase
VVLVGSDPAPKCVDAAEPFTGGSGRLIDNALSQARRTRADVFITNAVHCFLPDPPPTRQQIENHLPHLRGELEIVSPRLVIGMGKSAEKALRLIYPGAVEWAPRRRPPQSPGPPLLFFVKHPNRIRQWERAVEPEYVRRLAAAIRWAFRVAGSPASDDKTAVQ